MAFNFIDSRIEHAINNEEFIRKVASQVRPYVIFDENGSILADGGAMQDLDKIEVEKQTTKGRIPEELKVIITPKHHLAHAPLIEILSKYETTVVSERGIGHQWIYKLRVHVLHESGQDEEIIPAHFRLEILK